MQKGDPNALGFAIKNAVRAMERAFDFELRVAAAITLGQAKVVRTLTLGRDGMTQREIADSIGVEAPTLVPIIDKMVQEGLVERRQDEADRRNNRIFLTDKSQLLWNDIEQSIAKVRKVAYKGIAKEDLEATKRTMEMIAKNALDYLESQDAQVQKVANQ